jgi:hypothetical protein
MEFSEMTGAIVMGLDEAEEPKKFTLDLAQLTRDRTPKRL